jgi:hypothetical protein
VKRFAIVLFVAGLLLPLAPRVAEFVAVDVCLDRGGSYDYQRSSCDFSVSHPFIPWSSRQHSPVPLVCGALASLAAVGLLLRARSHRPPGP